MRYSNLFAVFLILIALSACNSVKKEPPKVNQLLPINTSPPQITQLVDLGGLDIPLGGTIPVHHSDQRFSPGEWMLIKGKNLGVTEVTIDGITVPVTRYFGQDPLIRVPTGLSPIKQHTLTLTTDFGDVEHPFESRHYIAITDTDGKTVHLIRTDRDSRGGVDEKWLELDTDLKRPVFNLISEDSVYLYTFNIKRQLDERVLDNQKQFEIEIGVHHLAAPDKPQLISQASFVIESAFNEVILSPDNQLLLLGNQSVLLLDVSEPTKITELGRRLLPDSEIGKTEFVDAVFLQNNQKLALLETYSNQVSLIDLTAEDLAIIDQYALLPGKTIPLSVDLEKDPQNDNNFWALITPNYRIPSARMGKLYEDVEPVDGHTGDTKTVYQLTQLSIEENRLTHINDLATPNRYAAHFAVAGEDGRLYLTTTKMEFFGKDFKTGSASQILKSVKSLLWDSVAFGRIVAIDLTTGEHEEIASGVGVYYHLVDVPDIGPVFSLLKFGPSFSFPYITPTWGVGVKSTGTYAKRKMDKKAVFPPYSVGRVSYQY